MKIDWFGVGAVAFMFGWICCVFILMLMLIMAVTGAIAVTRILLWVLMPFIAIFMTGFSIVAMTEAPRDGKPARRDDAG